MRTLAGPGIGHLNAARLATRWRAPSIALSVLLGAIMLVTPVQASAAPTSRAAALEAWLSTEDDRRTPIGWTGSVANCVVGTESPASIAATLSTVNTLRDFAGVRPVAFDPALNQRALAAALMMLAANDLSHFPGRDWPCFSDEGSRGAFTSNLYLGLSGASAIVGYASDNGVPSLGHRRYLLNPSATAFATGSTVASNALTVTGAWATPPSVPAVIAWPPSGHTPWPLINGSWSAALNVPGTIDASGAQVRVAIGDRVLPASAPVDLGAGVGTGNLLKWDVTIGAQERDADAAISVTISNVKVDGAPRQFSYTVDAMRAQVPAPTTFTASRTASTATIQWAAAAERGIPVTGYRVMASDRFAVVDQIVGPTVRELTFPYDKPTTTLTVRVIPQSRAGYPPSFVFLDVPPPATTTTPPPTGTPSPTATTTAPPQPAIRPPLSPLTPRPAATVAGTPATVAGSRARFVGPVTIRLVRPGPMRVGSRLKVRADVRGEQRLRYRWNRNGRPIAGATRSTYAIRRADRGRRISVRLTAVGGDGVAVKRTSSGRLVPRR